MPPITSSFLELLSSFRHAFRGPVYRNFVVLAIGAVLNKGRQTVCTILRVYPWRLEKHWSCFHHFFSKVKWSPLQLSKTLCSLILARIPADQEIVLITDDTLIRRWGKKVFRISLHRDPVRSGKGKKTVPRIRWVAVRDPEKKNKDVVVSTSRTIMEPNDIVSLYVNRWLIETMFEESRKHVKIETAENWAKKSVQRTVPLLLGLFSLIVLWYCDQQKRGQIFRTAWYWKQEPSFSDALTALRIELWMKVIFPETKPPQGFAKKNKEILKLLISKAA